MTKTPNYDLNQWDPEDRVIRTDFNEDNAKIDAAIAGVDAQLSARIDTKADQAELNAVRELAARSRFTKLQEITLTASSTEIIIDLSGVNWSRWDKVHLDILSTIGSQMLIYFNEYVWNSHVFYVSYSSPNFLPRITFYPGFVVNRLIRANCADTWAGLEKPYSELKRLIISQGTMPAGAKFILWGEE